jgi:dTDP-4-dehydrorhamnose 3,5-epimerase
MGKLAVTALNEIAGLARAQSIPFSDGRGRFARLFCRDELQRIIGDRPIVQINHSVTTHMGAVRGLHYQMPPHAEMKFVRCLRGRIWDVVVDLRSGSSTFLQWAAEELSARNERMLAIPEGCAHGFQVLEAGSEVLYFHTAPYAPTAEGGVNPFDPRLKIPWPLPVADLSDRDRDRPLLLPDFAGLDL